MNNRERAMNLLHYRPVDRLPAVHFGYWGELLNEWVAQGKISASLAARVGDGNEGDFELDAILGWDFNWQTNLSGANNGLCPTFPRRVLSTLPDGTQRVQSPLGVIERHKPGITSIPAEDDYLLKNREAFETLYRPKMQFFPERIDRALLSTFNETRPYDRPVGLHLGSVFGAIRDMTGVTGMSFLLYDEDEDLMADIVDAYADMQYRCAEEVLASGARFDFAHFWEDICFRNGPLLSPELFDSLCAKHYKKRTDLCHRYGIDIISLDCDGIIDRLIPTWIENGVNTLFPIEVGVWGDQFLPARKTWGKRLLGVGGMNKLVLRQDREAVDREIARMERLCAEGGFIPCPDHRLMPGTKFELVQYYTERIKSIRL